MKAKRTENINWEEILEYDESSPSGLLWAIEIKNVRVSIGDVVGCKSACGRYWVTKYNKKKYYVHRIVWELNNGRIPDEMLIDHLNGNGLYNNISNLRLVTQMGNSHNVKKLSSNTSGVAGVVLQEGRGGYMSWTASFFRSDGTRARKTFGVDKYGYDLAFNMACLCREEMLASEQVEPYTVRHGTE